MLPSAALSQSAERTVKNTGQLCRRSSDCFLKRWRLLRCRQWLQAARPSLDLTAFVLRSAFMAVLVSKVNLKACKPFRKTIEDTAHARFNLCREGTIDSYIVITIDLYVHIFSDVRKPARLRSGANPATISNRSRTAYSYGTSGTRSLYIHPTRPATRVHLTTSPLCSTMTSVQRHTPRCHRLLNPIGRAATGPFDIPRRRSKTFGLSGTGWVRTLATVYRSTNFSMRWIV
jgi:hypothetical protein